VDTPQSGTSWLGSPALFLPRRQQCEGFGENVTYNPPFYLVAYRLFVEFLRIVLPPTLLYLMGTFVTFASIALLNHASAAALVVTMPAMFLTGALAVTLVVAALKWIIIGKYRPRIEPLWAPFVRHSEFITGLYESAVVPAFASLLAGTPLVAPVLRLFGVKIGRRVYVESTFMTEFDLVHIGDDSSIGRATSLQSHLFEDRVMKMSTVNIGKRCSIGGRAVVLYDSNVGDDVHLDALSLVMKGESLPAGTSWRGIPARLV
jgi:non-ribosomal peptide synthetase-like protein